VAEMAIPHEVRPTLPPYLTLSGGTLCWTPASGLTVSETLHQADRALFSAKSNGRNRIEVADQDNPDNTRSNKPIPAVA
jgi:PleD family two-component response regulator